MLLGLAAQLVHLCAELLRALGRLRGLGDLPLQLSDFGVPLGQLRPVIPVRAPGTVPDSGSTTAHFATAGVFARYLLRLRRLLLGFALRRLVARFMLPHLAIAVSVNTKARLPRPAGKEMARTHQMGTG